MASEPTASQLRDVALSLGVLEFVDDGDVDSPEYVLRLASALLGVAEGVAMVQASLIAHEGEERQSVAMELLDSTAYRASRMKGPSPQVSQGFRSLWATRRLQAQITSLSKDCVSADLDVVEILLKAIHALLSGFVYDATGENQLRDSCRDIAADHIGHAESSLSQLNRDIPG